MSSNSDAPPFHHIAIVGVGLIGGSIALAVREQWPDVRVTGVDRQAVLAHARSSGAIHRGATTIEEIADADLVILAAPVGENVRLLTAAAPALRAALVTDVGGTKRDIVAAAARTSAVRFIGGHPIGGAERGGFGFARPDLFRGRAWIFTPGAAADSASLESLFRFVQAFGARPVTLAADEHDRVMAFLSHLPQLATSALMDVVGGAVGADGLRLAGRGLVDTTRLASSPASVWRGLCASNADAIGTALDGLIARLAELRADLAQGERLDQVFADAGRWRAELMKGRD
jgi:prephenate dehydrogenase